MILPNTVKYDPVSTTTSPVTQAAEVAVKMESVQDSESILFFSDKWRNTEPDRMMTIKKIMGKMIGEFKILNIFIPYVQK
jgi:hypothetical protein